TPAKIWRSENSLDTQIFPSLSATSMKKRRIRQNPDNCYTPSFSLCSPINHSLEKMPCSLNGTIAPSIASSSVFLPVENAGTCVALLTGKEVYHEKFRSDFINFYDVDWPGCRTE